MVKNKKLTTNERIKRKKPLEIWISFNGAWKWEVYKKYQKSKNEEKNYYARWLCKVYSPTVPNGEIGDVYIKDIKDAARCLYKEGEQHDK